MGSGKVVRLLGLHGRYQNRFRFVKHVVREDFKMLQEDERVEVSLTETEDGLELKASDVAQVYMRDRSDLGSAKVRLTYADGNAVEFLCVDAPHQVKAQVKLGNKNPSLRRKDIDHTRVKPSCVTRAWWYEQDGDPKHGVDDSTNHLLQWLEREGPLDGIMGFSQGASLGALLSSSTFMRMHGLDLRFALFASGYEFEPGLDYHNAPASLHMFSDFDRMIHSDKSQALTDRMKGTPAKHDAGHHLPASWFHSNLYDFCFARAQ